MGVFLYIEQLSCLFNTEDTSDTTPLRHLDMKIAVTSDLHLCHTDNGQMAIRDLIASMNDVDAEALIICGDIYDSFNLKNIVDCFISEGWDKPTWFVLGNHDYYSGSFLAGDSIARDITRSINNPFEWLDCVHPFEIKEGLFLLGTSCPYDMRAGVGASSKMIMADFRQTEELRNQFDRIPVLRSRADHLVSSLELKLNELIKTREVKEVIIASHVSPWWKTAFFRGRTSDAHHAATYVCERLGQVIENYSIYNNDINFLCLHGHTHGHFKGLLPNWKLKNIYVMCGDATYGEPKIHFVLDTEKEWLGARDC